VGLFSWLRGGSRNDEMKRIRAAVSDVTKGMSISDLEREGGWSLLDVNWSASENVWDSFSTIELEAAMRASSVIYACVRKIATVAPDVLMEIGMWDGDSWEPDTKHPDLNLLRQPNSTNDWRMFCWNWIGHLLVTGESWVWKQRNRAGEITSMHAIPSSSVSSVVDKKTGDIRKYSIGTGEDSKPIEVLPDDMFVMLYPDMTYPGNGVGPLQACLRDLQIDNSRAAQMIEILTQMHFAGLVVSQDAPMSSAQKRDIRSRVRDKIGPGKRGDVLFLAGQGAKAEFQRPPADLDWPGTANLSESRICAAFGIPPMLLGLRVGLDAGTFSNWKQAKTAFYQDTMVPIWKWMSSTLERGMYRNEGKEEEVEPNLDDVPELQEDVDAIHARAREDYHAGLITKNRALEILGEPTIGKAGDIYALPMNIIETPAGQLPLNTLPPEETVTEVPTPTAPAAPVEDEEGGEEEEEVEETEEE